MANPIMAPWFYVCTSAFIINNRTRMWTLAQQWRRYDSARGDALCRRIRGAELYLRPTVVFFATPCYGFRFGLQKVLYERFCGSESAPTLCVKINRNSWKPTCIGRSTAGVPSNVAVKTKLTLWIVNKFWSITIGLLSALNLYIFHVFVLRCSSHVFN